VSEDEVRRALVDHTAAPFPVRLGGEEIAGVEVVMLDADVAGCVAIWLGNKGSLDDERRRVLQERLDDLDRVLPLLDVPSEREYFERLRRLAASVLDAGSPRSD
jgi:hypothetical protein